MATIGVISDTHGLLREQALAALEGSDYIVHAGDIGAPEILDKLAKIAPVTRSGVMWIERHGRRRSPKRMYWNSEASRFTCCTDCKTLI